MTALAEALLAAQRQAIGALAKPYVAGNIGTEEVTARLAEIGCNDVTDTAQLLAAWDVLQEYGAPAPQPQNGKPESDAATDSQMLLLRKVADERGYIVPDYPLTKARASEIIDRMKAGTYNADDYAVPF